MATELTAPTNFAALSPQQQEAHRTKIGVRSKAILGQFWHDADTDLAVQAIEIEGWCDVLQNCSHSEIRAAWADYQRGGPRTQAGKLYKPDAGAIYNLILDSRPRPKLVVAEPEPPIERVTAERAAEIMAEVFGDGGLPAPKRMTGKTGE